MADQKYSEKDSIDFSSPGKLDNSEVAIPRDLKRLQDLLNGINTDLDSLDDKKQAKTGRKTSPLLQARVAQLQARSSAEPLSKINANINRGFNEVEQLTREIKQASGEGPSSQHSELLKLKVELIKLQIRAKEKELGFADLATYLQPYGAASAERVELFQQKWGDDDKSQWAEFEAELASNKTENYAELATKLDELETQFKTAQGEEIQANVIVESVNRRSRSDKITVELSAYLASINQCISALEELTSENSADVSSELSQSLENLKDKKAQINTAITVLQDHILQINSTSHGKADILRNKLNDLVLAQEKRLAAQSILNSLKDLLGDEHRSAIKSYQQASRHDVTDIENAWNNLNDNISQGKDLDKNEFDDRCTALEKQKTQFTGVDNFQEKREAALSTLQKRKDELSEKKNALIENDQAADLRALDNLIKEIDDCYSSVAEDIESIAKINLQALQKNFDDKFQKFQDVSSNDSQTISEPYSSIGGYDAVAILNESKYDSVSDEKYITEKRAEIASAFKKLNDDFINGINVFPLASYQNKSRNDVEWLKDKLAEFERDIRAGHVPEDEFEERWDEIYYHPDFRAEGIDGQDIDRITASNIVSKIVDNITKRHKELVARAKEAGTDLEKDIDTGKLKILYQDSQDFIANINGHVGIIANLTKPEKKQELLKLLKINSESSKISDNHSAFFGKQRLFGIATGDDEKLDLIPYDLYFISHPPERPIRNNNQFATFEPIFYDTSEDKNRLKNEISGKGIKNRSDSGRIYWIKKERDGRVTAVSDAAHPDLLTTINMMDDVLIWKMANNEDTLTLFDISNASVIVQSISYAVHLLSSINHAEKDPEFKYEQKDGFFVLSVTFGNDKIFNLRVDSNFKKYVTNKELVDAINNPNTHVRNALERKRAGFTADRTVKKHHDEFYRIIQQHAQNPFQSPAIPANTESNSAFWRDIPQIEFSENITKSWQLADTWGEDKPDYFAVSKKDKQEEHADDIWIYKDDEATDLASDDKYLSNFSNIFEDYKHADSFELAM